MIPKAILLPSFAMLVSISNVSLADPVEPKLPFYCNQRTGAFFLSNDPDEQPDAAQSYSKQVAAWLSLLKVGPERNQWGDPLRTGSRFLARKCGALTIIFSSGFLNSNPQGELGALDFPVVEIRKDRKVLLAKTALEQCAVTISRYSYFGACPDNWAQRIEVQTAGAAQKIQVKRRFTDEKYKDVERTDVYELQ